MKRTALGIAPLALALCMSMTACGDDGGDPGAETGETGDGDGDGDATDTEDSGDGDGDATDTEDSGDGDGDPTDDPTDDPGPDSDMDGTPDSTDNCPDIANPNQLDFDGNGLGNVCDMQLFTGVSGDMMTTASADAGIGSCSIPLMFTVSSGEILVQLDDDAAVAGFEIVSLSIDDIPPQECDLGLANAQVALTNFVMDNSGGDFPVSMPHDLGQHDGGQVAGMSDMPHPVLAAADLEADIGMGPSPSTLELDGALPVFTANITEFGEMGVLSWADPQFVLATDSIMPEGLPITIDFELRGLIGALTLTP